MGIPLLGLEQLHQLVQKIFHFTPLKPTFLFYTLIFTKHPHQFIYSTHLYNKIFILLQFFIIFFASLSLSAYLSLTNPTKPKITNTWPPSTTKPHPPSKWSATIINPPATIIKQPDTIINKPTTIIKQPATIINKPTAITKQPTSTTPQSSTHPAKHHQLTRPYWPIYPKPHSTQKKPKYPKSHSTQTKAKSTPFNPKPTDQTTRNKGKQSDRWRD